MVLKTPGIYKITNPKISEIIDENKPKKITLEFPNGYSEFSKSRIFNSFGWLDVKNIELTIEE